MLWRDHDHVDGTWETTPVQNPHHDAAMPGASDGSVVPGANAWDDVLTEPYPIPVPMEMLDDCGWGHHLGPQRAALVHMMS
ncbi:hypothetical protein BTVI_69514 [Pitangus sulphuratus]|nr:hypothetical protein BTVI_69514 [Pitangus sulphuratus]